MSLISSFLLIFVFIAIYAVLIEIYSVLFRITGMTKGKARFQSISLLTNCGYTTSESEVVVSDKVRRSIATIAMLTGYAFSVVIVSLLINVFLNLNLSQLENSAWIIAGAFLVLVIAFVIFKIPVVNKSFDRLIERTAVRIFKKHEKENIITIVDNYGRDAVAEIYLNFVPDCMYNKPLYESNVKSEYMLNILSYKRKGKSHDVSKDSIFQKGDALVVYGNLQKMNDLFLGAYRSHQPQEKEIEFKQNTIDLIETFGKEVLAEVEVNVVPEFLENKKLFESGLREVFGINIMVIKRNGVTAELSKDTEIYTDDELVVFGPLLSIKTVFIVNKDEATGE